MFNIVFAQLEAIPRKQNKFVEIAVAERYFIIAHVKRKSQINSRPEYVLL